MDPLTMSLLGGTALQGISGIFGSLFGSNSQQKALQQAQQFQLAQQQLAQQFYQQQIQKAIDSVNSGVSGANTTLGNALTGATGTEQGYLGQANQTQQDYLSSALGMLAPYAGVGQAGMGALANQFNYLTSPVTMSQADLQATPGYQFTLDQALRAQQQSATTRGLGLSGAALKGAADYATGVSDQTYNTRYQQALQSQGQTQQNIMQLLGIGQQASGQGATLGAATGSDIANRLYGGGFQLGGQQLGVAGQQAGNTMSGADLIAQLYAGLGQGVSGQIFGAGQTGANLLTQYGQAGAQGILGATNAVGNAGGALSQYGLLSQLFGNRNPSTGGGMYANLGSSPTNYLLGGALTPLS